MCSIFLALVSVFLSFLRSVTENGEDRLQKPCAFHFQIGIFDIITRADPKCISMHSIPILPHIDPYPIPLPSSFFYHCRLEGISLEFADARWWADWFASVACIPL